VKERPILFSAPMVQAILAGRKTQTRRVMKPQPKPCPADAPWARDRKGGPGHWWPCNAIQSMAHVEDELQAGVVGWEGFAASVCPYGQVGDRLWVRETWAIDNCGRRVSLDPKAWPDGWPKDRLLFAADDRSARIGPWNQRPSIHMPRWASRITLEITGVCVERIMSISGIDALAEGIESVYGQGADCSDFKELWDSINAERGFGWDANPWVWAISFRRMP
jgi:hypothetical protein